MNERLKRIRQALGLTQQEFAIRINAKQTTISTWESGRGIPLDSTIQLIVREFNVSETWLRTGEGEMFIRRTQEAEIAEYVGRILSDADADFQRRLVLALSRIGPDGWAAVQQFAASLLPPDPGTAPGPGT